MKLRRLVRGDIHFQWKYGFYFIYFVLTVIYVFGITALPDNWKHNAAAIMIYSDPAAMGLFFMGAIVLLEKKSKGTPCDCHIAGKSIRVHPGQGIFTDVYILCSRIDTWNCGRK